MNGSWLGRGRGGRLAIYAGCTLVLIFIMLLYRATSTEMSRLRKLNELCTNQQEALATQLQVIYEYKIRLEKFLADEKNSNAVAKQELQQRASQEKSLRDKDSIEAMQRYNALQQTYKLLQTENQDLEEEFKKYKVKMEDDTKKHVTLVEQLRNEIKSADDDKKKAMEHLKSKYMELENEKVALENKYNELFKTNGNNGSIMEHLKKEIIQLKRELAMESKKNLREGISSTATFKNEKKITMEKAEPVSIIQQEQREQLPQPSPSNQLQVSRSTSEANVAPPLEAPQQKEKPDEAIEDVAFALRDGQIVPADPNNIDALPSNNLLSPNNQFNNKPDIDELKLGSVKSNNFEPKMVPNVLSRDIDNNLLHHANGVAVQTIRSTIKSSNKNKYEN